MMINPNINYELVGSKVNHQSRGSWWTMTTSHWINARNFTLE